MTFAQPGSGCGAPETTVHRFLFVLDGAIDVHAGAVQRALASDDFAYFPPDTAHMCVPSLTALACARLR